MAPPLAARRTAKVASSIQQEVSSAQIGSGQTVAPPPLTTLVTSAQGAENRITGLRAVLERKKLEPSPPYNPEAWHKYLHAAGMQEKYPGIPGGLRFGFDTGIQPISQTFAPLNHPSITKHSTKFNTIIQTEFQKERYISPVTWEEVELLIRPFQTSPLSIIPKLG
jgi:hypothetical protein